MKNLHLLGIGFSRPWLRSHLTQSSVQLEGSFSFWRHAEVVVPRRVDLQLGRDARTLQGQVHEHAVLGVGAPVVLTIVGGVGRQDRRRIGRDAEPLPDLILVSRP